jgi:hypothetical protein
MLWVPLILVQHLSDIEQTFDVDAVGTFESRCLRCGGQTLLRRLTSHVSDMWRYRSMQHWFYLSAIHFKLTYDKPCVNVGREQPENYVCQTLAPFDGVVDAVRARHVTSVISVYYTVVAEP